MRDNYKDQRGYDAESQAAERPLDAAEWNRLEQVGDLHDHQIIKQFAKRVAYLVDGKIIEDGGGEIISNPQTAAAQAFIAKEAE